VAPLQTHALAVRTRVDSAVDSQVPAPAVVFDNGIPSHAKPVDVELFHAMAPLPRQSGAVAETMAQYVNGVLVLAETGHAQRGRMVCGKNQTV
jgi:hypothetical protein